MKQTVTFEMIANDMRQNGVPEYISKCPDKPDAIRKVYSCSWMVASEVSSRLKEFYPTEAMTPILPTVHHCPALDEYRAIYAHYEAKGLVFTPTSVPIAKVNYIKQEGFFFTRISEQEFNELNNGSDEE